VLTEGFAPAIKPTPINRPNRARYLPNNEMLVVNTGAGQVLKVGKGGFVGVESVGSKYFRWVFDRFSDPLHLLRPGQPLSISSPTDAAIWQEMDGNTLVIHCLVADSGNHRIVDLVYRIKMVSSGSSQLLNNQVDELTGYYLPELNWVTKTDSLNQKYIYDSIQVVRDPSVSVGTYDVWAAISNYSTFEPPSGDKTQAIGGAVVAIRYRQKDFSRAEPWNYSVPQSGEIVAKNDRVRFVDAEYLLSGPRFIHVSDTVAGRYVLICDNRGVYKAQLDGGGNLNAVGVLIDADYSGLDRDLGTPGIQSIFGPPGVPGPSGTLRPASVQELPGGRLLVANSYSGSSQSGTRFSGEVFEYDMSSDSIVWSSPRIEFDYAGGPMDYVWRQQQGNSYLLRQPRSAVRQQ